MFVEYDFIVTIFELDLTLRSNFSKTTFMERLKTLYPSSKVETEKIKVKVYKSKRRVDRYVVSFSIV